MESACVLRLGLRRASRKSVRQSNLPWHFFQNAELAFFKEACIPMGCQKVSTDRGIFMFNNFYLIQCFFIGGGGGRGGFLYDKNECILVTQVGLRKF